MTAAAQRKPSTDRNAMLAKIHIAKKELGLDDDTYRDILERITGQRSAAKCTDAQLDAVLADFKKKGFRPKPATARRGSRTGSATIAETTYLPKLRALWISAYNLGIVRNQSDQAMVKFLKRQTGLDSERFLVKAVDAGKAIEGLKKWMAREAELDWRVRDWMVGNERQIVVMAQWRRLIKMGAVEVFHEDHPYSDLEKSYGYRVTGKAAFHFYRPNDWDKLIVTLGNKIRFEMSKAAK